tara:strand:- start:1107 stop:1757 length:651 start_codon:yes stop_codon:yes gene_type:complete
MKFASIIVTRNKSCHVKTLHTILRFNLFCLQKGGVENEVVFVNDDPFEKSEIIHRYMKTHERLFFVDYGIHVDDESLKILFQNHDGIGCLVLPGVKEGIDWNMFKNKVKNKSKEPVEQLGLSFDTVVDRNKKISDGIYVVSTTSAKSWLMLTKNVIKHIKDKKSSNFKIYPKLETMFSKFKDSGVKIHAYTKAKLVMTYNHECISNILNAYGVKSN